jgi:hypothetical protein
MRRVIIIIILLIILGVVPATAQSLPQFETVRIEIWPEYDRPDVLVIYRMELAATEKLPVQISMRIPTNAGTPYNIAYQDADGSLYTIPYSTENDGDWLRVIFSAPTATLQLEYYDPDLIRDGTIRTFEYQWPGDINVNNLSISVQEPLNATKMKISPAIGDGETKADGLVYYTTEVGQVEAGTVINLSLEYDKPDDTLSASMQPVQPSQPIAETDTAQPVSTNTLVYILGGLGVLLIVGGVVWFLVNRENSGNSDRRYREFRHAPTDRAPRTEVRPVGDAIYCHQCGNRAEKNDVFCRTCGTRLRTD